MFWGQIYHFRLCGFGKTIAYTLPPLSYVGQIHLYFW